MEANLDQFHHISPEEAPGGNVRHLLNAAIAPRPIAWVSTVAADGTLNLAPHSYTTVFSTKPPIVGFVSTGAKDTLRNARSSGEFVYNIVGEELGERMNLTSADFPPDVSEFSWTGLTPVPGNVITTPRVGEAPIAMECRLVDIYQVPGAESWLVLGEVVYFHIADRVWRDERIDPMLVQPLTRLGGNDYGTLGELFKMKRPTYAGLIEESARTS
jgi:flavin reductase (DIM6/NTAB) family NADH-FMN oxidoreductase RutF